MSSRYRTRVRYPRIVGWNPRLGSGRKSGDVSWVEREIWGWDVTEDWILMQEAISGLGVEGVAGRKRIQRGSTGQDKCSGERRSRWGRLFWE